MRKSITYFQIISLLIFALALFLRIMPGPRTIDDSFITYRYAQNILAGNGFVFNPGERVLGTTTPLYTLLLSGIGLISGGKNAPFVNISLGINAVADAITCLLLLRLGRRMGVKLAGIGAAIAWAVAPFSVTFAIGGLETSVYILLLMATVTSALDQRYTLSAFLGGLTFLTRPDALILLGPMSLNRIAAWVKSKRNYLGKNMSPPSIHEAVVFILPVSVWLIFAGLYFGNPLPHSMTAKAIAYRLPTDAAFVRLLQHYATPFMGNNLFGIPWIVVGLLLFPALFAVGALNVIRKQPYAWFAAAYPWLYFATFAIANPLIFRWYLSPPLPLYYLFILIGIEVIFNEIEQTLAKHKFTSLFTRSLNYLLILILPGSFLISNWTIHPDHALPYPAPEMAWVRLEQHYRSAVELLQTNLDDDPLHLTLAAGDVGVLGYFSAMKILDTVGLNSPISSSYYPADPDYYIINYAIPPGLIIDQKPDFVVILEVYGRAGLLPDERFQRDYRLIHKIPTDIYGSDGMLIFERIERNTDNYSS